MKSRKLEEKNTTCALIDFISYPTLVALQTDKLSMTIEFPGYSCGVSVSFVYCSKVKDSKKTM